MENKSAGYERGVRFGKWFHRNEKLIYYSFCTVGTVISMICGNICATMLGCTMLICHHIRAL